MQKSFYQQDNTQNAQTPFARIRALIQHNVKHASIAAVAIALFLGVAFSFAMKGNMKAQALATVTLPVQEQAAPEPAPAPVAIPAPMPEPPAEAEVEEKAEPVAESGRAIGSGHASYYGDGFAGRPTANGETFNPAQMTAAHKTLPFGSKVKVTNTANGKSVVVRINDRGPFVAGRLIDLSEGAAREIDMISSGTANVKLELLS